MAVTSRKSRKSHNIFKVLTALMLCASLCSALFCNISYAKPSSDDEKIENTVRVGWYESQFFFKDSNGRKDGYGYEYHQKIAAYTGWKVEYVEGTWTDLFYMLQNGEIDVLSDVNRTYEREKSMLFSNKPMGIEEYYILVKSDNDTIREDDYSTLNGKKVGIEAATVQVDMFKEWEEQNDIEAEIIASSVSVNDLVKKLESGEFDAVVSSTSFNSYMENCIPIAVMGSSNFYFAINKERDDLKADIDYAMDQLFRQNKYYNEHLDEKYMTGGSTTKFLGSSEKAWLDDHGTIVIGFDKDNAPYCTYDENTGEVDGFIGDFAHMAENCFKNASVKIELRPFDTSNDMIEALKIGEVDAIFPMRITSYDAEQNEILITEEIGKTELFALIKEKNIKSFNLSDRNYVAIRRNDINARSTAESNYPSWKPHAFDNYEQCISSVAVGATDCLLISNYRKNLLEDKIKADGLTAVSTGLSVGVSFAVAPENMKLYAIMNKILNLIPDTEISTSLIDHSYTQRVVTFRDFLRDNFTIVLSAIGFIFIVIIALLAQSIIAARRERKAAEAAEAASYAKTSFLFNMSHDIRTPMNAIMGFRDLLEKNQDDPVLRADYLNKIKESSAILLSILNNVLEMARIEKGTISINETAVSNEQMSDSLFSLFNEMMAEKNIKFERTIKYDTPYIYVDMSKTREIFMNIISNAYKYTPSGGTVRMDTVELPCDKDGYIYMKTEIRDNGIGMDEDFLPEIFTEFSRERGVNMGKIEGTGLGMAIVKRLVDFLGGTVAVKSKKGEGTTFIVTLPHRIAQKADLDINNKVEVDADAFKGKNVLVAEDNDINAEIITEVLKELGISVERAEDGRRCVEMYLEMPDKYDFILMDVQMPNMNGYEATKEIRKTEGLKSNKIPIIAMTANAFEEDRRNAYMAGMDGHVAKPIDLKDLMHEIARVIS